MDSTRNIEVKNVNGESYLHIFWIKILFFVNINIKKIFLDLQDKYLTNKKIQNKKVILNLYLTLLKIKTWSHKNLYF